MKLLKETLGFIILYSNIKSKFLNKICFQKSMSALESKLSIFVLRYLKWQKHYTSLFVGNVTEKSSISTTKGMIYR